MSPSVWPDASSVLTSKIPRLFVLKARTNSAQARELESYLRFRAAQASAQQSQAEAQPSSKSKRNVSKEKNTSGSKRAAFPDSAYPTKDSTSGGWAGGEVGLRKFLESATLKDQEKDNESAARNAATRSAARKPAGREAAAQKPTDPQMYPSKTILSGGFAGGERGLQQFVEEGEISFADQGSSQYSPLTVALVVSVGITAAALLLNAEVEQGEQALGPITIPRIKSLNIGAATVPLVQAAAIGLAVLGLVTGSGILARKIGEGTNRAAVIVLNGGRTIIFWLGLFLAVKIVLDSS